MNGGGSFLESSERRAKKAAAEAVDLRRRIKRARLVAIACAVAMILVGYGAATLAFLGWAHFKPWTVVAIVAGSVVVIGALNSARSLFWAERKRLAAALVEYDEFLGGPPSRT